MIENVERVKISEFRVERPPRRLKIAGLGSCVALAFYDPEAKIGGLAHILLPGPDPNPKANACGPGSSKYADQAVAALRRALGQAGADPGRIVAKIVGGAYMFQGPPGAEQEGPVKPGVGERNVEAVRKCLAELAVPLAAEDVGGNSGRTIVFDLETGELIVTRPRGGKTIL